MWLLIWIASCVLAPMIAASKGASAGWAFVGALLFGPLAVIYAALRPRDERALERHKIEAGEMRKCPSCAEAVRVEALKCRYCSAELPPLAASSAPVAAPKSPWPS
jgi:hypothetical protein